MVNGMWLCWAASAQVGDLYKGRGRGASLLRVQGELPEPVSADRGLREVVPEPAQASCSGSVIYCSVCVTLRCSGRHGHQF
jgi:hypothetical protein